jgi:hypothetical protein
MIASKAFLVMKKTTHKIIDKDSQYNKWIENLLPARIY